MKQTIHVTKAGGNSMPFSEDRLKKSLYRSGAAYQQVESILDQIRPQLYEGITTKQIYRMAFSLLKGGDRHLAARYHLKHALMELGPSGFPFEQYIAGILSHEGYAVQTGQIIQGLCVEHEIDVIAEKENDCILIECKYHNSQDIVCNIRTPLYIHARFLDVQKNWCQRPERSEKHFHCQIVTNTRFSEDAIRYAGCYGLELIGWDFPAKKGLKDRIDSLGLYPVTCLTSLTKAEKQKLLDKNLVLCKDILENEHLTEEIGIYGKRSSVVLNEVKKLCHFTYPFQNDPEFHKKHINHIK